MADKRGGYVRPTITTDISCSWQCHRNRRPSSTEPGTDYACAYGSAIFAAEDGVIVDVNTTTSTATGRYVTIDLDDGRRVRYLHLSRAIVSRGRKVTRGQEIAKSGASGFGKDWAYGAHVHATLWDRHAYSFGSNATLDFHTQVEADNDGSAAGTSFKYDQVTADVQASLNRYRGESLVIDGLRGPATIAALKRLQAFLGVTVDGIWGPITNAAYNKWVHKATPTTSNHHPATVNDLRTLRYVNGLQKIAKLYGYTGKIDNIWGSGSKAGLQKFLNQNYGGSLAAWLRAKHGYVGNDQWGPVMAAAAVQSENANWKAL